MEGHPDVGKGPGTLSTLESACLSKLRYRGWQLTVERTLPSFAGAD